MAKEAGELSELQKRIVEELQVNSRISFKELAEKLHFSPPTIASQLHELESAEVVQKFTVQLDYHKLGFLLRAIASVSMPNQDIKTGIQNILATIPQVVRYYRVTGVFDYYVELVATSLADLDSALISLSRVGKTQTSIILESYEKNVSLL